MGEHKKEVIIVNKRGLHARASAKFVSIAAEMSGSQITVGKDGQDAGGASILGLMMLGAAKGDTISLKVDGEQAENRLAELVELVETGFGEE